MRAGLPARTHRGETRSHLPAQAGRIRSSRRHHGAAAQGTARKERKTGRLYRCGPCVAHRRKRSTASGLRRHDIRTVRRLGGLMRTNIPAFRLPANVLDEEIGYIVDMGADLRLNSPVKSMRQLLDSEEFDAVFVGSGAPKGKELELPGRHDTDRIHIGSPGWNRSHSATSNASGAGPDHRRRQYGDGLLPQLAAPRRQKRQGHGTQAAAVLQASEWELEDGTRRRRHRDQPRSQVLRHRGGPVDRNDVRKAGIHHRGRRHQGHAFAREVFFPATT